MDSGLKKFFDRFGMFLLSFGIFAVAFNVFSHFGRYGNSVFIEIFDDALMFLRYADNLLAGYGIAWNPAGVPVYGTTSIFHTLVTAVIRFFYDDLLPAFFVQRLSLAYWGLFAIVSGLFMRQLRRENSDVPLFIQSAFWTFSLTAPLLVNNARNGMETVLTLSLLLIYLIAIRKAYNSGQRKYFIVTALIGGLIYPTRPDAALYVTVVPGIIWLFSPRKNIKFLGLAFIQLIFIAIFMGWSRLYFGYALPLPFYVKSKIFDYSVAGNMATLLTLLAEPGVWIFILLILVRLPYLIKNPVTAGVMVAMLLHLSYFLFLTNQNMGMFARFNFPNYASLLFLAAIALSVLPQWLREKNITSRITAHPKFGLTTRVVVIFFLLIFTYVIVKRVEKPYYEARRSQHNILTMSDFYKHTYDYYYQLYAYLGDIKKTGVIMNYLMNLPEECVIAGTEMGITGITFSKHKVIDMVGLNYEKFVFSEDRDIIRIIMEEKPDLFIMPHQAYRDTNMRLINHPIFIKEYTGVKPIDAVLPLGLAFNSKSACYPYIKVALQETGIKDGPIPEVFPDLKSLYPYMK